jgi:hypothetical protein
MYEILNKLRGNPKTIAIVFIIFLAVSYSFPIIASIVNKQGSVLPIIGSLDVFVAIVCFVLFILISQIVKQQKNISLNIKTQTITQYISSMPLLLIILYFMGIKLNWQILLIGLGWRYWLLIIAIPYLVAAFQKTNKP